MGKADQATNGLVTGLINAGAVLSDNPSVEYILRCARVQHKPWFHIDKHYPLPERLASQTEIIHDLLDQIRNMRFMSEYIDFKCSSGYIKHVASVLNDMSKNSFAQMFDKMLVVAKDYKGIAKLPNTRPNEVIDSRLLQGVKETPHKKKATGDKTSDTIDSRPIIKALLLIEEGDKLHYYTRK
jgi:hypothetical protein